MKPWERPATIYYRLKKLGRHLACGGRSLDREKPSQKAVASNFFVHSAHREARLNCATLLVAEKEKKSKSQL